MKYRKLGSVEIEVSVVGVGSWAMAHSEIWGEQNRQDAIRAIHASLDAGANLIDVAEGYGHGSAEELVGEALSGYRDRAVICTKASPENHGYQDLIGACEASLRRLKTDYIDIYMLHWPNHEIPLDETARALESLRTSGKINHIAVANFGTSDLEELSRYCEIEANQLPYNLLWRLIEDEYLPKCMEQGIGVLCYSPLAQGLLSGRYHSAAEVPPGQARTAHFSGNRPMTPHTGPGAEAETFATVDAIREIAQDAGLPMSTLALAWLLQQPGVTSVIAGPRSEQEAIGNCKSADLSVSDDVLAALTAATSNLKAHFGSQNPDMWGLIGRMR